MLVLGVSIFTVAAAQENSASAIGSLIVGNWVINEELSDNTDDRVEAAINRTLGAGSGVVAVLLGAGGTIAVQSSSITTSVLVPLAASGLLTLENIYPVTLGANVGTTVTALLASLATGSPAAVTVAIVHTLFNVSGIVVFYPVQRFRRVPLRLATGLAEMAASRRSAAIVYAVGMFVVLPLTGVLILR